MAFERHCWAELDLDALLHNLHYIKEVVGGELCAVVKADAYGHGAPVIAPILQKNGVTHFAVSCLAEGVQLRRCGITGTVLILGFAAPEAAAQLAEHRITATAFSLEYARALSAAAVQAGVTVQVHLKVDTGMGRIGFCARSNFDAAVQQMEEVCRLPGLAVTGIFQHFAVADSDTPDDIAYTDAQHALFCRAVTALEHLGHTFETVHCANSAAQMRHPEWRHDLVRAGIILYGLDPSSDVVLPRLRPVMTLKALVTYLKDLQPGQSVSYGRTFLNETDHPLRVATVCVGYADGYPRLLSGGKGVMMIHGQPAPVVGRVCMDQTIVDVTDIPGVRMGDEVTVLGPDTPAGSDTFTTAADKIGTINYELICGLRRRVPRMYLQGGKVVRVCEDI